MPSQIDATKPVTGNPSTQSVRDNFLTAKNEITAAQAAIIDAQNAANNAQGTASSAQIAANNAQTSANSKAPMASPTFSGLISHQDNTKMNWGVNPLIISPNDITKITSGEGDLTVKKLRLALGHFTNAQLPTGIISAVNISGNNFIAIGGGNAALNAATQVDIYTAPNSTTPTGTSRLSANSLGQISINHTTPHARAILHIESTDRGFLPPRMTQAQRDAIYQPPSGLIIFNSTTNKLNVMGGAVWEQITSA